MRCSVLGMHLFGGKFCRHIDDQHICTCSEILDKKCTCNRKNFDTLHWSLVTVFQVCLIVVVVIISSLVRLLD